MATIKQILAASGDWFVVTNEMIDTRTYSRMTRVPLWGIISGGSLTETTEEIHGIDTYLAPILNDESYHIKQAYVHGDDASPTGKTWRELFKNAPADRGSLHAKDISFINNPRPEPGKPESPKEATPEPEPIPPATFG